MENVTYEELEKIINQEEKVLVDFWGEACRPCEAIEPILKRVSSYEKFKDIKFLSLNVTLFPEAGAIYGIFSVPTLVMFIKGKEVDRKVGFIAQNDLEQFLFNWKEEKC
jgi:thioredoxin 1